MTHADTDRNAGRTRQAGLKPRRSSLRVISHSTQKPRIYDMTLRTQKLRREKSREKQTSERRPEDLTVKRFWKHLCQPEGSVGADFTFTCVRWSRRDGGALSVKVRERRVKTPATGCRFDHFHTTTHAFQAYSVKSCLKHHVWRGRGSPALLHYKNLLWKLLFWQPDIY